MAKTDPHHDSAPEPCFAGCFPDEIPRASAAPLAGLDYAAELALKERALDLFWKKNGLRLPREAITATPRPRAYRTTSKRRLVTAGGVTRLTIGHGEEAAALLEPPVHGALYAAADSLLARPAFRRLAALLGWLIIRDNGHRDRILILNTARADARVARDARLFAEAVAGEAAVPLSGAILFLDPSRSEYYLEQVAAGSGEARTLFGRDTILMEIAGVRFSSPALAFTQVSREAAGILAARLTAFLATTHPAPAPLFDVYCGYGLFSRLLDNGRRTRITGIDASEAGIRAARRNQPRGHFSCDGVSPRSLERLPGAAGEIQIVDPPRSGLPGPVVAALAARRPALSLNLFCDIDRMPAAIESWRDRGYRAVLAMPVDMFAGCAALETAVAFVPA